MDPHLLRTFVAVAHCGSFSRAAGELGYTQSAVSQHIAALENDLGTVLLNRRPVVPTKAGARLLEHAEPLLLRLDAARAEITRMASVPTNRLVVGFSPLAFVPKLGVVLASRRWKVTVRVLPRADVPAEVASGVLDVGLVDGIVAPNDPVNLPDVAPLKTIGVAEEPLAVAVPTGHPLAGRRSLDLADLAASRWIDAPESAVSLTQLRTATGIDGFRASMRYEGTHLPGLLALASAGLGLVLLPASMIEGLAAVPIARLVHRVELVHGHGRPAAVFAEALR